MKIETIDIERLKEYPNNAKIHTPAQIEQIARSIDEFGNNDPIAVDENDQIIEGHGRLLALKKLGRTTAQVIRLTHLNDEQKRAYILVHNKLTMNSEFDNNVLDAELAGITDFDMAAFSFDEVEISPDGFGEDFELADGAAPLIREFNLAFTPEQFAIWTRAIDAAKADGLPAASPLTNDDSNAVAEIVRQFGKERGIIADD